MCFLLCLERTEEGARGRHCERSPRPHENTVAAPAQPIPQRAAQKYVRGKSAVAQAETGYGHVGRPEALGYKYGSCRCSS